MKSIYNWYRSSLRNPKYRWWVILGTLLYIIIPIDLAPDLFPLVGQIDDIVIVTILVSELIQMGFEPKPTENESTSTKSENVQTIEVESVIVE